MFRLLTTLSLLLFALPLCMEASPSDSIDVVRYEIHVDTINYTAQSIEAHTEVVCTSSVGGLNTFTFDLLKLTIDSVRVIGGGAVTTQYNDTLLRIRTSASFAKGDTIRLTIWYHGVPKKDPSGFGGFYFSGTNYVYNIGVGFEANPHNYGRVWFPCKDNFTDHALYRFHITTLDTKMAVCNGTLTGSTLNGNGTTTWHWDLQDPIPTYLASMAVAGYVVIHDTFAGIGGNVPISLYVLPADTTKARNSFAKLKLALAGFESSYGSYVWERVGYVAVPFSGGAMEHATNIAYPVLTITGTTTYEYLWAHELSHHWFGDLVTCLDAGDMWINEGFAAYNEAHFMELVYGNTSYKNYVRTNHYDVLRTTHVKDGGYYALSGIPHDLTYGSTVYDKGASVAHTLRYYLGSSNFFSACTQLFADSAFRNISTTGLRDYLTARTGVNLTDFFSNWVQNPGFTHFRIDSVKSTPAGGGNYTVRVYLRQSLKEAPAFFESNKLNIGFLNAAYQYNSQPITFSGSTYLATFTVPFNPLVVSIDPEEYVADATTDNYQIVRTSGAVSFPYTNFSATAVSVPDSGFVRVIHNWVMPDTSGVPAGIEIGKSRYYTIEGDFKAGFRMLGTFTYNGSTTGTNSYLDNGWFTSGMVEDSLALLWRPGSGSSWQVLEGVTINFGSNHTDRIGNITLDSLRSGEYTLGLRVNPVGLEDIIGEKFSLQVFPNPTLNMISGHVVNSTGVKLLLVAADGELVGTKDLAPGVQEFAWNLKDEVHLIPGAYILIAISEDGGRKEVKVALQ